MARDIYSEKVVLFHLAMEGPTTWTRRGELTPEAWGQQATVVARRYDIPPGIIEQQAFKALPSDSYDVTIQSA